MKPTYQIKIVPARIFCVWWPELLFCYLQGKIWILSWLKDIIFAHKACGESVQGSVKMAEEGGTEREQDSSHRAQGSWQRSLANTQDPCPRYLSQKTGNNSVNAGQVLPEQLCIGNQYMGGRARWNSSIIFWMVKLYQSKPLKQDLIISLN